MLAEVVLPLGASWGLGWAGAPLHPPPQGVSHGLGMELSGNPIPKPRDAGAEHPPPLPALGTAVEQQVGAPELALPAGDFQGQESHQKILNLKFSQPGLAFSGSWERGSTSRDRDVPRASLASSRVPEL